MEVFFSASLTTIRQVDLKKIIAYSSIGHCGFITLGLFSFNPQGIEGALILMLSHGFVASGLFLCIGMLYDRTKTLSVKYYSGLVHTMPLFSVVFLFFTLGNLGLPGTSSFCGEFLILVGAFQVNTLMATLASSVLSLIFNEKVVIVSILLCIFVCIIIKESSVDSASVMVITGNIFVMIEYRNMLTYLWE